MFEDELASREDAAEKIGNLLGWSARDTIKILGGPWRAESDIVNSVNPNFFVGRAADSVALLFDLENRTLTIGKAVGHWANIADLLWDVEEPQQTFGLESLSTQEASDAADAAFASKRRSLRICRYCGELLGRERMAGDQQCYGCGTRVFGAVY
jgi:hypothetical protein